MWTARVYAAFHLKHHIQLKSGDAHATVVTIHNDRLWIHGFGNLKRNDHSIAVTDWLRGDRQVQILERVP